jgi:hypothetical protein
MFGQVALFGITTMLLIVAAAFRLKYKYFSLKTDKSVVVIAS